MQTHDNKRLERDLVYQDESGHSLIEMLENGEFHFRLVGVSVWWPDVQTRSW